MIMVDLNQNLESKKSASKETLCLASRLARGDYINYPEEILSVMSVAQQYGQNGVADSLVPYLKSIREPLAEYQEKKGISRTQNYTFFALISAVCQYIYTVVMCVANMVYNLFPIIDAFLLILRFLLDKGIDCLQAQSGERVMKSVVFLVEFIAIVFMVLAITGLIIAPLSVLFSHVFNKLWHAVF